MLIVTPEQVEIARHADHIYIEEIKKAGLYRVISQGLCPASKAVFYFL